MTDVRVMSTVALPERLAGPLRRLLDAAFDDAFTDEDWEHCLGGWHAVALVGDAPVAHAAVVPRRLEIGGQTWCGGYVEGVATAPPRQGTGLGSAVMRRLTDVVRAEFDVGALSTDAHPFYERLGWERWRGPTHVRRGGRLVRTPEEDAGIMVLRFGPSRDLALDAPIVCEERAGDDW